MDDQLIDRIEAMVTALAETRLTEFEIRQGDTALRLRRRPRSRVVVVAENGAAAASDATSESELVTVYETVALLDSPRSAEIAAPESTTVTAGLVGTFRARSKAPLAVGDRVAERETIGQIESMRLMNDCVAPVAGVITELFVEDQQPVEYGQPLFEIMPESGGETE